MIVFSQWRALKDIQVVELIDHPFYWVEIPGYLPTRIVKTIDQGQWSIDRKLRMQVLGGAGGKVEKASVLGSVRSGPFSAKAGEILQDSVCVYQPEVPGRKTRPAGGDATGVTIGKWTVRRAEDGRLSVEKAAQGANQ